MNQRDATVKVIEFFRETPEGAAAVSNDKNLARALTVLDKRADVLRIRLERRRTATMCRCGRHKASSAVCWQCFSELPDDVRLAFGSKSEWSQRAAIRLALEHATRRGLGGTT
jgi:hypothetical protein